MEDSGAVGTLVLIPSPLGEEWEGRTLPALALERVRELRYFAVEELRTARRYLAKLSMPVPIGELELEPFDRRSSLADAQRLLAPVRGGLSLGVISEAGAPGIADPGALLVAEAHRLGIPVEPLVGPSSILLTLMASGLNGQNFAFVGYLPVESAARIQRIHQLEHRAQREGQSQLFIETPYRNESLFQQLLTSLSPRTQLCLGYGLHNPGGWVRTKPVAQWRKAVPHLGKTPTLFAIL